jgi:aspartyl-tRNA(Asn)/glutamyl-tRNA(Gln) amidotransferase subunit C
MDVTPQLVKHIATLSRLQVSDTEITTYQDELTRILGFVETLNQLDESDSTPASQDDATLELNPVTATLTITSIEQLRDDVANQPIGPLTLLTNAPQLEANQFVVPNIL